MFVSYKNKNSTYNLGTNKTLRLGVLLDHRSLRKALDTYNMCQICKEPTTLFITLKVIRAVSHRLRRQALQ